MELLRLQKIADPSGESSECMKEVAEEYHKTKPRKRAMLLYAFVVCLGFLLFLANLLTSFARELVTMEEFWRILDLLRRNFTDVKAVGS